MLRLAGRLADGVLLNYLPASHVPWCVHQVRLGGAATVYANVHLGVGDRDAAAAQSRFDLFSYVVVDAYAKSFARAGFADEVTEIKAAHAEGDRAAALAAISDRMLDAIQVVGDEVVVAAAIDSYRQAGVDVPVVFPVVWGETDANRTSVLSQRFRRRSRSRLESRPRAHCERLSVRERRQMVDLRGSPFVRRYPIGAGIAMRTEWICLAPRKSGCSPGLVQRVTPSPPTRLFSALRSAQSTRGAQ